MGSSGNQALHALRVTHSAAEAINHNPHATLGRQV